jgi:hypothetical protein
MTTEFELKIKMDSGKEFSLSEIEARELQSKLNALFGETKYVPYTPYVPVFPTWYERKPFPYDYYTITCSTDSAGTFKIDDNYVSRNSSVSSDTAKITLENNSGKITY